MPINKKEPRVVRYKPLKQNIRIWFDYLQTAIKHKYVINKEYYRDRKRAKRTNKT